jgi:hypothetical protein
LRLYVVFFSFLFKERSDAAARRARRRRTGRAMSPSLRG